MTQQGMRGAVRRCGGMLAALVLLGGVAAWAQDDEELILPGQAAPPAAPAVTGQPLKTLADALPFLAWRSADRGPLLVVGAAKVRPYQPKAYHTPSYITRPPVLPLIAPAKGHLNTEATAAYFGQKIVRLPTLTVLAPAEMTVINPHPGPAHIFDGLDTSEKMVLFQASLSPSQWRLLGSAGGIGYGDMEADQRELFLSVLPDPMRLIKGKADEDGDFQSTDAAPGVDPSLVLSAAQRRSVRLRVNFSTNMSLRVEGGGWAGELSGGKVAPGTVLFQPAETENDRKRRAGYVFGQQVWSDEERAQLKPGDLDFDAAALDPSVSLVGAKTVGDMVKAVRSKTGVELYIDSRAAALPCYLSDASVPVRAGDLLKGLCWGISGTFRRVGPDSAGRSLFILTDDLAGIGARKTAYYRWNEEARARLNQIQREAAKKIRAIAPYSLLSFAPDDPLALSPAARKVLEPKLATASERWGSELPTELLTGEQRKRMDKAVASHREETKARPDKANVKLNTVSVRITTVTNYLIPGVGTVEGDNGGWGDLDTLLPKPTREDEDPPLPTTPAPLPRTMAVGGVLLTLAPRSADEAAGLARLARERGLRQWWVQIPDNGDATVGLKWAVAAAKETGLPVCATLRLMRVPAGDATLPAGVRDVNILGETGGQWAATRSKIVPEYAGENDHYKTEGDWLLPDSSGAMAAIQKRLASIAQTPGLAGVVFRDTAARGYDTPEMRTWSRYEAGEDMGYTLENRMAFIRAESLDPVDLTSASGDGRPSFSNFSNGERRYSMNGDDFSFNPKAVAEQTKWGAFRYAHHAALLKNVYAAAKAAFPSLPVYLQNLESGREGEYILWDKADGLPHEMQGPKGEYRETVDALHKVSSRALYTVFLDPAEKNQEPTLANDPAPPGSVEAVARLVHKALQDVQKAGKTKPTWDGIVFDMTLMTADEAKTYIAGAVAPVEAKQTAQK